MLYGTPFTQLMLLLGVMAPLLLSEAAAALLPATPLAGAEEVAGPARQQRMRMAVVVVGRVCRTNTYNCSFPPTHPPSVAAFKQSRVSIERVHVVVGIVSSTFHFDLLCLLVSLPIVPYSPI